MRKRIVIDVEYDPNSVEEHEMVSFRLMNNMLEIANDGYLDFDSETIIENWDFNVFDLPREEEIIALSVAEPTTACQAVYVNGLDVTKTPIGNKASNREPV